MERNEVMMLNNIVYRLYESDDFLVTRKNLLTQLKGLIPYSYASILLSDMDPVQPGFTDPVCVPEEFLPVEQKYIKIARKDHTLWTSESGYAMVFCESQVLPDNKRLNSPIYQECYSKFHIYDTLQANITYNNTFLGVMTLYRTRQDGVFSNDDVTFMRMVGYHLNRMLYRRLVSGSDNAENAAGNSDRLHLLTSEYDLTARESQILDALLAGQPEASISESLNIAPSTLKKHMQHIYRKLGISTRWELLRFK